MDQNCQLLPYRKNDIICLIEKDDNEPDEHFNERSHFITKQKPQNEAEYEKAVTFSYVFINNKYLHCEYDAAVMNQLKSMIDK